MTKRKTYHVTSGSDGGWKVKEEKASRASSSHETKAEAVERAKELEERGTRSDLKIEFKTADK